MKLIEPALESSFHDGINIGMVMAMMSKDGVRKGAERARKAGMPISGALTALYLHEWFKKHSYP